jgi:hypothetical protein
VAVLLEPGLDVKTLAVVVAVSGRSASALGSALLGDASGLPNAACNSDQYFAGIGATSFEELRLDKDAGDGCVSSRRWLQTLSSISVVVTTSLSALTSL